MITANNKATEALSSYSAIDGSQLLRVWQFEAEGSVDRLVLDFPSTSLLITADEDDDSITCSIAKGTTVDQGCAIDVSGREPWESFIGRAFGWGWVTVNQQGYCDGLLLSFDGIVPELVLNVMASSIKTGTIVRTSV
jgi:hypothetical protein